MVEDIHGVQSALNFVMNAILVFLRIVRIVELYYTFEKYNICLCAMIMSCILFTRYKRILSFL